MEYLTLYAFSTENWRRPVHEVAGLMLLLERFLSEKVAAMNENGVRLATIGRTKELPTPVRKRLERAMEETAHNTRLTLTLALNYGGRDEIVEAARSLAASVRSGELALEAISQEVFASRLTTLGMPDPDLLIRTSGELRLSNFLLWQLSYTEIHVTQKLWPDFGPEDLSAAIADYPPEIAVTGLPSKIPCQHNFRYESDSKVQARPFLWSIARLIFSTGCASNSKPPGFE